MEEKKKFDWKSIAIVIMAVLLVSYFMKVNSLSRQNQSLNHAINNQASELNRLESQINSIYENVEQQLKREASLISGIDYSIGDINADKTSVSLNLSVVPKSVFDGMEVSVNVDGKSAELERNGHAFEGTIDVGMFILDGKYPLLTIETEAGMKTEYLEDIRVSYLFGKILPQLKVGMSGRSIYSGGKLITDMDFSLSHNADNSDVIFTSFTLVEEIDGKEINREDMTDAVKTSGSTYTVGYNKSFEIERGSELSVYMLAEDSLGYVHKTRAWGWYQDKDGATAEAVAVMEHIYDEKGKLCYPVDSGMYE